MPKDQETGKTPEEEKLNPLKKRLSPRSGLHLMGTSDYLQHIQKQKDSIAKKSANPDATDDSDNELGNIGSTPLPPSSNKK